MLQQQLSRGPARQAAPGGPHLLRVALGHLLDQPLAQQLLDGGARQAAVDLRPEGGGGKRAGHAVSHTAAVLCAALCRPARGRAPRRMRTRRRSDRTEGVIILYLGTSVSSFS